MFLSLLAVKTYLQVSGIKAVSGLNQQRFGQVPHPYMKEQNAGFVSQIV